MPGTCHVQLSSSSASTQRILPPARVHQPAAQKALTVIIPAPQGQRTRRAVQWGRRRRRKPLLAATSRRHLSTCEAAARTPLATDAPGPISATSGVAVSLTCINGAGAASGPLKLSPYSAGSAPCHNHHRRAAALLRSTPPAPRRSPSDPRLPPCKRCRSPRRRKPRCWRSAAAAMAQTRR